MTGSAQAFACCCTHAPHMPVQVRYIQVCGRCVPVGACSADLGMVALSRGTVLVSGSGVLVVGDVGTGLGTTRGFLFDRNTHIWIFYCWSLTEKMVLNIHSDKNPLYLEIFLPRRWWDFSTVNNQWKNPLSSHGNVYCVIGRWRPVQTYLATWLGPSFLWDFDRFAWSLSLLHSYSLHPVGG